MLAEFGSTSFTPDKLLAGNANLLASKKATLLTGQNLTRGAVLGKISLGAATAAAVAGGTGTGVLTMDATTPILANAQVGVYRAACITAATNGGTFRVTDPKGNVLGDVAVGATFANQVKFSIADGTAADFIVGDAFTITIAAGTGKYVLSLAAAVDGSQEPDAILQHDMDATAADKEAMVYIRGDFNENALTIGTGHTAASIREGLRDKGIRLVAAQAF